jgi:hypothetical protein
MNPFLQWPLGWAATSLYNNSKAKPVVDDWTSSLAGLLGIGSADAADDTTTPPTNPVMQQVATPTVSTPIPEKQMFANEFGTTADYVDPAQGNWMAKGYDPSIPLPPLAQSVSPSTFVVAQDATNQSSLLGDGTPQNGTQTNTDNNDKKDPGFFGGLLDSFSNKDWGAALTNPLFVMGANLLANSTYDPTKQDAWSAIGAGAKGGISDLAALQKIKADKAAKNSFQKVMLGVPGQEPRNGFFDPTSGRYYYANGQVAPDNARIYSMNAQGTADELGLTTSSKSKFEQGLTSGQHLQTSLGRMTNILDKDPGVVGIKGNVRQSIEGLFGQSEVFRPILDQYVDAKTVAEYKDLGKTIVGQVSGLIQDDPGRKSDKDIQMAMEYLATDSWMTSPLQARSAINILQRVVEEKNAEYARQLGVDPKEAKDPAQPSSQPPKEFTDKLKKGVHTKAKNGQVWTLDENGNPMQVK